MITSSDRPRVRPLHHTSALRVDEGIWTEAAAQIVHQSPLIETGPSIQGLEQARGSRAPGAVFVGVGLCTRRKISRDVPFDVLGLLLPAELLRRAVGAQELVVLVADSHALDNQLDAYRVRALTRRWVATLERLGEHLLHRLRVLRASELHDTERYRDMLAEVRRRAPRGEHAYVLREVADVAHLHGELGGLLKVGWSLGSAPGRRDERYFDARIRGWLGPLYDGGFVYCKAGRALDDARPRVAPYIATEPERRICLSPREEVETKMARASVLGRSSASTIRGVRRHLKMIARAYRQLGHALEGPVERRVQTIIDVALTGGDAARRARGLR